MMGRWSFFAGSGRAGGRRFPSNPVRDRRAPLSLRRRPGRGVHPSHPSPSHLTPPNSMRHLAHRCRASSTRPSVYSSQPNATHFPTPLVAASSLWAPQPVSPLPSGRRVSVCPPGPSFPVSVCPPWSQACSTRCIFSVGADQCVVQYSWRYPTTLCSGRDVFFKDFFIYFHYYPFIFSSRSIFGLGFHFFFFPLIISFCRLVRRGEGRGGCVGGCGTVSAPPPRR